jgi:hypothetical protein
MRKTFSVSSSAHATNLWPVRGPFNMSIPMMIRARGGTACNHCASRSTLSWQLSYTAPVVP